MQCLSCCNARKLRVVVAKRGANRSDANDAPKIRPPVGIFVTPFAPRLPANSALAGHRPAATTTLGAHALRLTFVKPDLAGCPCPFKVNLLIHEATKNNNKNKKIRQKQKPAGIPAGFCLHFLIICHLCRGNNDYLCISHFFIPASRVLICGGIETK